MQPTIQINLVKTASMLTDDKRGLIKMAKILSKAHRFILENARLLERRLYEVHFENESPVYVG